MGSRCLGLALVLGCCRAGAEDFTSWVLPDFGSVYHVSGTLYLPYAEIVEPFEAWYNLSGRESRIQFYNGQVVTYQHGFEQPFGINYKISPETTETEVNVRKCFQVNGTNKDPVLPQSVLPNLEGFKPVRQERFRRLPCTVWQNVTTWGKKKNVYTLWVTNTSRGPEPVHYEMRGFNSLLGSHYDKYEVAYHKFSKRACAKDFKLPEGLKCEGFPGPGLEHHILANPMQDFFDRNDGSDRVHRLFNHYADQYGKEYGKEEELEHRKRTFTHNMRYVHSKNRAGLPYKLALNHLADHTWEEMSLMRGRQPSREPNRGQPFPEEQYQGVILPDAIDWRLYGAVTPVKDQAVCGSCWSFATTGALEGALFMKTGNLVSLSQQMLIDCTWGFGNNACDGGEEWRAYEWIMKHEGIATTESYGAYMGQNGYCHYNHSEMTANITGYTNVTSGNVTALKTAIFKRGPVAVSIDAAHKSFAFYSNGVYYEPECGNKTVNLDHAVLAVGYGVLNGDPYWLVKNSWSTYWGNDGYVLMSMKDNNCGVATDATYPTFD
ncbi:digestive cysteine proteinase 2-like [Ambystoma mexicanum]|uniref:digestive cysteine proteinase 2-like n=1 Tax=Ambystoma mexicanum TaxID=8296 RepID=UPI0037E97C65